MGDKLPAAAVSGNFAADSHAIEKWHLQKQAWQRDRAAQGNLTVDVLRYTESGGDATAGIQPTYSQVSGLSSLAAYVDTDLKRYAYAHRGRIEEADRVFVLYDVTGGVTLQDRITYDGDRYKPLSVDHDSDSGRVEVVAALDRSDV